MTMAEHYELVAEITYVEKLTPQERLKHAKKRRQQQLKKFTHYEKQLEKEHTKKRKTGSNSAPPPKPVKEPREIHVVFVSSVMLLEAASRNDVEEVKYLLQKKVSPDVTNEDGLTALHQCCIDNSEDMLQALLEYGANVNARDSELWTPLHAAATCGHVSLCKYLIDAGAELLAVNADGNMPYDICEDEFTLDYIESEMAKRGITQEEIDNTRLSTETQMLNDLKELVAEGGSLDFSDRSNASLLHIAAANGYIQVAEFLLENRVTIDSTDEDGWQPIHAAACWCQSEILELLVQHGADLDAKTRNGETPFDICEDPDLKQRILNMKDELETKAANKQREHDQMKRRSRNRRSWGSNTGSLYSSNTSLGDKHPLSASIRRTSMREKNLLSLKEAREEAAHFGLVSKTDEEDVNQAENNGNYLGEDSSKLHLPTTNIDDIAVSITNPDPGDETLTREEHHGINGDDEHKTVEVRHSDNDSRHINRESHNNNKESQHSKNVDPRAGNKDSMHSGNESTRQGHSVQNSNGGPRPNNAETRNSNNVLNGETEQLHSGSSKAVQRHSSSGTAERHRPNHQKDRVAPPPPTQPNEHRPKTVGSDMPAEAPESTQHPPPPHMNHPGVVAPPSRDVRYPSGVPTGTLADLKKFRAEKKNNTLRLRDSANLDAQVEEMFLKTVGYSEHPRDGYGQIAPSKPDSRNGHNNSLSSPRNSRSSTDRPLRRFTAPGNTQIIGGDEQQKQKCCVIM